MNNIFLVSKKNLWSNKLNILLSNKYNCKYYNSDKYQLDLEKFKPSWIFFFHWSKLINEKVFKRFRCVVFHTGNLPEQRGGSPIQNQILNDKMNSFVNAIKVEKEIDSGDIYCNLPITLQGSLTDIWLTIANIAYTLIQKCIEEDLKPCKQIGKAYTHKRNTNNQIPFNKKSDLVEIHNFIQMLDAEGYPNAYINVGKFRLEFIRSKINENNILSDVIIKKNDNK